MIKILFLDIFGLFEAVKCWYVSCEWPYHEDAQTVEQSSGPWGYGLSTGNVASSSAFSSRGSVSLTLIMQFISAVSLALYCIKLCLKISKSFNVSVFLKAISFSHFCTGHGKIRNHLWEIKLCCLVHSKTTLKSSYNHLIFFLAWKQ